MKKQHLLFATFILAGSLTVSGQTPDTADSLSAQRTLTIDEVVVTGTRHQTDIRHLSQTVSVVNRKRIEQSMQPSLLPVLTEQVPGLFTTSRGVMGYGVSNGAAGGISLRGLSGGNARLMVLIDGHPQYAGIFGHPIADAYQTLLADRVEVLRGPASVLYGSNAMGGVVNIVTRKMHEDGIRTHLHTGYGSYNTLETELTNRIRKGRFSSVISGSYNRTDGHRADMGFEQYGGYGRIGYEVTDHWNLRADVNVTHFNASYPGPVSAPLLDGDQRRDRRDDGLAQMALPVPALDLAALGSLTFALPDEVRWPALRLAREAILSGGAAGAVLNAAKEQALDDFIAGRIRFTEMAAAVEHALERAAGRDGFGQSPVDLAAVLEWDGFARQAAAAWRGAA